MPYAWGVRSDELGADYPCDRHLTDPEEALARAVHVEARAATTFLWICR